MDYEALIFLVFQALIIEHVDIQKDIFFIKLFRNLTKQFIFSSKLVDSNLVDN